MYGVVSCLAGCRLDELAKELFDLKANQERKFQSLIFSIMTDRLLKTCATLAACDTTWPELVDTAFEWLAS